MDEKQTDRGKPHLMMGKARTGRAGRIAWLIVLAVIAGVLTWFFMTGA
jgi:hypothetical protein